MKKVRQYNLSHETKYVLVDVSKHETEDGWCCENCGAFITNIATIKDTKDNKHYHVGMDCAETLTSIKDSEDFQMAKTYMRDAQKIANASKKFENFQAHIENSNGIFYGMFTWIEKKPIKRNGKETGEFFNKQTGSGFVGNNTISLLPMAIKKQYNLENCKWD